MNKKFDPLARAGALIALALWLVWAIAGVYFVWSLHSEWGGLQKVIVLFGWLSAFVFPFGGIVAAAVFVFLLALLLLYHRWLEQLN